MKLKTAERHWDFTEMRRNFRLRMQSFVLQWKFCCTRLKGYTDTFCSAQWRLFFFNLFIYLFIYLFMSVLGLRFCARAFSSCGKRGPLFIAACGPLTIAASLVAEHRLQTRRLSSCGSRAQLLRGMWDLPRSGLESVSPALASGFSTTASPGKPERTDLNPSSYVWAWSTLEFLSHLPSLEGSGKSAL